MTAPLLTRFARAVIARRYGSGEALPTLGDDEARGVFVTLRERPGGRLRGCMGRIEPVGPTLSDDLETCALLAATEDPRFPPLAQGELDKVDIEVTLLDHPQPIGSAAELDPATYGVVVRQGPRTGVLLPDIDGIDTPAEQVDIARQKAGISPGTELDLYRFTVQKFEERA